MNKDLIDYVRSLGYEGSVNRAIYKWLVDLGQDPGQLNWMLRQHLAETGYDTQLSQALHRKYSVDGYNPTDIPGLVAWYDPSDSNTMFTEFFKGDAVTNNDPVGLMLDKSQGLVKTPLPGPLSYSEDTHTYDAETDTIERFGGTGYSAVFFLNDVPNDFYVGKVIKVTFDYEVTSGTLQLYMRDSDDTGNISRTVGSAGESGSFEAYSLVLGPSVRGLWLDSNNARYTITGLRMEVVAGNHLYQNAGASRPTYYHNRVLTNLIEDRWLETHSLYPETSETKFVASSSEGKRFSTSVRYTGTGGTFDAIADPGVIVNAGDVVTWGMWVKNTTTGTTSGQFGFPGSGGWCKADIPDNTGGEWVFVQATAAAPDDGSPLRLEIRLSSADLQNNLFLDGLVIVHGSHDLTENRIAGDPGVSDTDADLHYLLGDNVDDFLAADSRFGFSADPDLTVVGGVMPYLGGEAVQRIFQLGVGTNEGTLAVTIGGSGISWRHNNGARVFSVPTGGENIVLSYGRAAGDTYGESLVWRNGEEEPQVSVSGVTLTPTDTSERTLLMGRDGGTNLLTGRLYNVAVLNRVLSDAERQAVEAYMALQAGITL